MITKQDFENGNEFHFEFQESCFEQVFCFVPELSGDVVGLLQIEEEGYMQKQEEVISIHKNYAILQFQKFDRKYTYKLHFQNCNPIQT